MLYLLYYIMFIILYYIILHYILLYYIILNAGLTSSLCNRFWEVEVPSQ